MFVRNYYLSYLFDTTVGSHYMYSSGDNTTAQRIHRIRNIQGNLIPSIENFGYENGGETYIRKTNPCYAAETQMKKNKSDLICDASFQNSTDVPYGLCFGNGDSPESFDGYNMSGELFTNYSHSFKKDIIYDDDGVTQSYLFTLTNNGTEDFTIKEVGFFDYAYMKHKDYSRYYRYNFLVERTVLDSPITIPANGGVGQVTLTFRANYPTV